MKTWTPSPIRTLGSPRLHGEPCFQVYSVWFLLKMLHLYFMLKCFSLLCRENKFSSRQVGDLHWFAVTWKVKWREKKQKCCILFVTVRLIPACDHPAEMVMWTVTSPTDQQEKRGGNSWGHRRCLATLVHRVVDPSLKDWSQKRITSECCSLMNELRRMKWRIKKTTTLICFCFFLSLTPSVQPTQTSGVQTQTQTLSEFRSVERQQHQTDSSWVVSFQDHRISGQILKKKCAKFGPDHKKYKFESDLWTNAKRDT